MRCTLLFTFAAIAQAASISTAPIPVTGGGHWWYDHTIGGGDGWSVSFSGSLDGRYVSLSGNCNSAAPWCRLDTLYTSAAIDGQYFGLSAVSFALGADGWIVGRNGQGAVTESINGVWTETTRVCYYANACEGSFAIVPGQSVSLITSNPEPGSIALVLAGLAISIVRQRRRNESRSGA